MAPTRVEIVLVLCGLRALQQPAVANPVQDLNGDTMYSYAITCGINAWNL
jgi:hypothetical protein